MNWGFIFREGVKGLGRNITMTIALVITTALSLALVGTGILCRARLLRRRTSTWTALR